MCGWPFLAGTVRMFMMGEGRKFRVMRGVIIGHNRPVRSLVMVTIVVIHGHTVLDPNHLINIEIGSIEKTQAGVDTAELVCDPLVGEVRLKSDDAFAFLQEPSQGRKVVVNCPHTPTVL